MPRSRSNPGQHKEPVAATSKYVLIAGAAEHAVTTAAKHETVAPAPACHMSHVKAKTAAITCLVLKRTACAPAPVVVVGATATSSVTSATVWWQPCALLAP